MRVLFLQNIKGVAQIGDIKDVSAGHARNYLIPRKLAKPATSDVARESEGLKKQRELIDSKNRTQAEEMAKRLEGAVVEISEGANQEGHLYGSVDAKKIAQVAKIPVGTVMLEQPIKTIGDHPVKLQLHQTIATTLTVRVLPS